jgi:hypothetical protein
MDYYSYDFDKNPSKNHLIRDQCQLFLLTRATLPVMATPLGQVEVQQFRDQLVTEASVLSEYRLSLLSVL